MYTLFKISMQLHWRLHFYDVDWNNYFCGKISKRKDEIFFHFSFAASVATIANIVATQKHCATWHIIKSGIQA